MKQLIRLGALVGIGVTAGMHWGAEVGVFAVCAVIIVLWAAE